MARVVQVGAIETQASYNRALNKTHIPVIVAQAVEPGQDLTPTPATMLKMEMNPSTAAMCLGEKCAMWRWGTKQDPNWTRPTHPPASFVPPPSVRAEHGFCGLAGTPGASA